MSSSAQAKSDAAGMIIGCQRDVININYLIADVNRQLTQKTLESGWLTTDHDRLAALKQSRVDAQAAAQAIVDD